MMFLLELAKAIGLGALTGVVLDGVNGAIGGALVGFGVWMAGEWE